MFSAAALTAAFGFAQDPAPAPAPATGGQVYQDRQANQQKRIANGQASGKLSTGQAAKLDKNQAKINHEVAKDAAKNGGALTPGEKAKVHKQMNKESKDIAKDKNVTPKGPAVQ
jgi:hypothetical protein